MTIKVFISYKHQDAKRNEWVEKLYRDLRSSGIDAKLDKYEVRPGESFSEYMTQGIREANVVLFIITPNAVKAVESGSGALAFEMQISNARRLVSKEGFLIIPVFREGKATSTYLSDHRYLDFRDDKEYDSSLATLIQWLYREIKPPPLGVKPNYLAEEKISRILGNSIIPQKIEGKLNVPTWDTSLWLVNHDLRLGLQEKVHSPKYKHILSDHYALSTSVTSFAFLHSVSDYLYSLGTVILPLHTDREIEVAGTILDKPILIFELIMNSGASLRHTLSLLNKGERKSVDYLVVLYNDLFPNALVNDTLLERLGIDRYEYFFKASSLIDYAEDNELKSRLLK